MAKKNKKPETSETPATPATDATDATGATGATPEADAAKDAEKARERAAAAADGVDGLLNRFVISCLTRWVVYGEYLALEELGFERVNAFGSSVVIHRDQTVFRRISAVARLHGFAVKARLIENMGEKLRILESIKRDAS